VASRNIWLLLLICIGSQGIPVAVTDHAALGSEDSEKSLPYQANSNYNGLVGL